MQPGLLISLLLYIALPLLLAFALARPYLSWGGVISVLELFGGWVALVVLWGAVAGFVAYAGRAKWRPRTGVLARHDDRPAHVVTVDHDGVPVDPTTYDELDDASFDAQLGMLISALERSGKKKLLVFVHGGLNNRAAGQRHVEALAGPIAQDGYYPIFLNWNSDLLHTALEDLLYVRQGRIARWFGPASALPAIVAAVATGISRAPLVWAQMFSSDVNASGIGWAFTGKRNSEAIARELQALHGTRTEGAIRVSLPPANIPLASSIVAGLRYAATFVFKLALSPLIDGIGQGAWRNMLRRTQMLFHREDAFDVRDNRDPLNLRQMLSRGPSGAAYKLFRALERHLGMHPHIEVTLVGHSMGTIVLNRVLKEFPGLKVDNVVYMAAACSIDEFRTSVVPYLQTMPNARFYNLMLHPEAEVREWHRQLADLTPRGSLLVWIDNFLAAPVTTLDRTLGCWENVMQAAHVIPRDIRPRTTLKAFPYDASRPVKPARHGDFNDKSLAFWKPEFWRVAD